MKSIFAGSTIVAFAETVLIAQVGSPEQWWIFVERVGIPWGIIIIVLMWLRPRASKWFDKQTMLVDTLVEHSQSVKESLRIVSESVPKTMDGHAKTHKMLEDTHRTLQDIARSNRPTTKPD